MPPHQSHATSTYTTYQEEEQSTSENQKLLQEVLGETLIRNQEHLGLLIDHLKKFSRQRDATTLDEQLCVSLAREVLRHRLGKRSHKLPVELYDEVGRALWTNKTSRERIERLWDSLVDTPAGDNQ